MIYMAYTLLSIMPVLLGGCCITCGSKMQRGCSDLSTTDTHTGNSKSPSVFWRSHLPIRVHWACWKQRIRGPRESVTHWVLISSGCWHAGRLYRINVHMFNASSPVYPGGKTHSAIILNLYWYNAKIEPKLHGWEEKKRGRNKNETESCTEEGRPYPVSLAPTLNNAYLLRNNREGPPGGHTVSSRPSLSIVSQLGLKNNNLKKVLEIKMSLRL